MHKIICDRCKNEIKTQLSVLRIDDFSRSEHEYDLCQECLSIVRHVIEDKATPVSWTVKQNEQQ